MRRGLAAFILAFICVSSGFASADDAMTVGEPAGLLAKWRLAERAITDDEVRLAACRAGVATCSEGEQNLETIIQLGRLHDGRARIGVINRAVNLSIRPVADEKRFGVADHWSSPIETVNAGIGDCEDYAILKLLALEQAGVPRDDLRLVIVHDRATGTDHALAGARLEGHWLLLDNRTFALVDLDQTHYRVLAQLSPDSDGLRYATLDDAEAVAAADFM